ncbi:hypothetical protein LTR17_011082 [Elasticomyces elasticus]|nr:hypothetical protein LTR17_011082 [Elasticomyces elasticus]
MPVPVARPETLARLCSASCRLALGVRRPQLVRHFCLTPRIQLENPEARRSNYRNVPTGHETASTEPLPITAFLERVKNGTATIDDAQCCLSHHQSILADLPPSTRQEQARSLSVGGQLLTWLWEVCHDDRARVYNDQLFSNRLCWFLVLEDLEDLVWKWIKMETKQATESPMAEQLMHPGRGRQWTGRLLGGLAQAHLDLAPGRVADNALRRFRQVADLRSPDGTGFLGSQLVQMRVAIQRALLRNECPRCDAKLFDHFVASTPVVDRPDRVALTRARLRLFHPTKPTARPILHLVRVKHPIVEKVLREARPAAIRSMTSHMLRAACILCLEDADDDASFLEALVQQKDPKLWYNREKFWVSQTADPKLKALVGASERSGELSHIPARWSTASALSTQVSRTRTLSVPSVRSRSFSQCARPQVIAKRGYAFTIGRFYSKGYHEGDSEDTGAVSIETFVKRVAANSATISDAQSCVLHHYKLSKLPSSQTADVIISSAIGTQVLQWLLTRECEQQSLLYSDHQVRDALCWLLFKEGKEDSTWDKIVAIANEVKRHAAGGFLTRSQIKDQDWMGQLLAGFAATQLELAPRRVADNAIKRFQRMIALREEHDIPLPLAPMAVLLRQELRQFSCVPCDPQLFDDFLRLLPAAEVASRHALSRARMLLYHPSQATAELMLGVVRSRDQAMETEHHKGHQAASNSLSSDVLRAAYILRLHGKDDDAMFLDGMVEDRTPSVWHARNSIWKESRRDPKLHGVEVIRRRPLPAWGTGSKKTRMFSTSALLHSPDSPTRTGSRSFSRCVRLQAAGAGSDALMVKIDKFQKSVEEGKATIEDAQHCLLELQADLIRLPLDERRLQCQELKAGGKVLRWLWGMRKADYANIYDGPDGKAFAKLHTWFLVPEDLEEFVWKWLHIVAARMVEVRIPGKQWRETGRDFDWSQQILGGVADARVQWSVDGTANSALETWKRADSSFGPGSRLDGTISLVACSMSVARQMWSYVLGPCDPQLFERWVVSYTRARKWDLRRAQERNARVCLFHPTRADAGPMFDYVFHSGLPVDIVMLSNAQQAARNAFATDVMRAAYILTLQGRTQDAVRLEGIVEQKAGTVFQAKAKVWKKFERDPRLQHLRESDED